METGFVEDSAGKLPGTVEAVDLCVVDTAGYSTLLE